MESHQIILSADEARHAAQVMRLKVGDSLSATDGKGIIYKAKVKLLEREKLIADIISKAFIPAETLPRLAIGILKHPDRMEWLVEKAVEMGVDEIYFLNCDRSEKKGLRMDRLQRAALAAMKQSGRVYLPKTHGLLTLDELLEANSSTPILMATVGAEQCDFLNLAGGAPLWLIGPEGDFSEREMRLAAQHQVHNIGFGDYVMRTETAGIFALSVSRAMRVNR